MQQAPLWLPYRIRTKIDQWRILRAIRGIERTKPMPAADPKDALAEANMLLCKRDLKLGVVAFKSLLRMQDDKVKFAGTVINDGSLSKDDMAWFDRHIPNCRWQTWKQEDPRVTEALDKRPHLAALYRQSKYEQIAKMVHPICTSRCPRVVQFDSDTAFFRRPERIFRFCLGEDSAPLYLHDHQDESKAVPPEALEGFADLHAKIGQGKAWGLKHRFFNAGFLAYRPEHLSLDDAERYLAWRESAPQKFKEGKPGIWFGPWTPEQTSYHVMYTYAKATPVPLGDDYWLGGADGRIFNHFLRFYIVRKDVLKMIRGLIEQYPR